MPRALVQLAFVLVAVSMFAAGQSASADQLFVDNVTGNDRADGKRPQSSAEGGPVRSLRRALDLAQKGDRIIIADTGVPYREGLALAGGKHSGFGVMPLVIEGNGAVLDGSLPVPDDAWDPAYGSVYRFRPPHGGAHQLFHADGKPAVQLPVDPAAGKLPELEVGQWCSHNGAIYFNSGKGKLPRTHAMRYAALPVGILLYQVHDVRIVDLTIQGFYRYGVHAHDGLTDVSAGGLILRGNGAAGLMVGGSSSFEAIDCLIGNNGSAQVIVGGHAALSLKFCQLLENPAPALVREGTTHYLYIDGERK